MNDLPPGQPGTIWFKTATPFEYHNDPAKTREATSPDGTMTTVNDVGYVDDDGYLFLTDRKTFMIISGGVNIYPQETENLLITHDGYVKIIDFGLAKLVDPLAKSGLGDAATVADVHVRTADGVVLGTLGYMSPEQVRGEAVDARSDVFSFGAVLYEMVTGKSPFKKGAARKPSARFSASHRRRPR